MADERTVNKQKLDGVPQSNDGELPNAGSAKAGEQRKQKCRSIDSTVNDYATWAVAARHRYMFGVKARVG